MRDDEAKIVRQCIAELLEAGFVLSVYDGGGPATVRRSADAAEIFAAMGTTDEDTLAATHPSGNPAFPSGAIYFVYGNEPGVVIADNSTKIEAFLTKTTALAESLEA